MNGWFNTHFITPVVQNLMAAVLGAGAMAAGATAWAAFGGCTPQVQADVANGEVLLLQGHPREAMRVASDATVTASRCACSHALMAASHWSVMKTAQGMGDSSVVEEERKACFQEATLAISLGDHTPRSTAIQRECKAQTGVAENGLTG